MKKFPVSTNKLPTQLPGHHARIIISINERRKWLGDAFQRPGRVGPSKESNKKLLKQGKVTKLKKFG